MCFWTALYLAWNAIPLPPAHLAVLPSLLRALWSGTGRQLSWGLPKAGQCSEEPAAGGGWAASVTAAPAMGQHHSQREHRNSQSALPRGSPPTLVSYTDLLSYTDSDVQVDQARRTTTPKPHQVNHPIVLSFLIQEGGTSVNLPVHNLKQFHWPCDKGIQGEDEKSSSGPALKTTHFKKWKLGGKRIIFLSAIAAADLSSCQTSSENTHWSGSCTVWQASL